jgi:uncharacterized protein YbbK (DUF523 family)
MRIMENAAMPSGANPHLPSADAIAAWPRFTPESPMRVLVSGCVAGLPCGVDGSSYGEYPDARRLLSQPNVRAIPFCPEESEFGTPREMCNVHGGTGDGVLDGRARVLTESGVDWTEGMIRAAHRMLAIAREQRVHLAMLMDISAACGSQVIYDGPRHLARYQIGAGVCAALLRRNGFTVISQRDYRTLDRILAHLDAAHVPNANAIDHHETEWYRSYFGTNGER